jgi:hypothetical protein
MMLQILLREVLASGIDSRAGFVLGRLAHQQEET